MKSDNLETHEFLPSGEWEGFYCYNNSPLQHKMSIQLRFSNNKITGSGIDDIEPFTWSGKYDLNDFKSTKTKSYSKHKILYKGDIDENGIWGIWENVVDISGIDPQFLKMAKQLFKDEITGGFHIWPKKSKEATESITNEEKEKSTVLEELFIEYFS